MFSRSGGVFIAEETQCVVCPTGKKRKGDIKVDSGEVIFYICKDPECHKKLLEHCIASGYITDSVDEISLDIDGYVYKFKNDKRVLRGLPTKIAEILKNGEKEAD